MKKQIEERGNPPFFLVQCNQDQVQVENLDKWNSSCNTFGFLDPSSSSSPGWPLRNFLVLIRKRFQLQEFRIICFRENSLIFTITINGNFLFQLYLMDQIIIFQKRCF